VDATVPVSLAVPADLTDADDRRGLLDEALRRFGRVEVLVNNARIARAVAFGDEDPNRLYATNLLAPFALTRLVLPGMLEREEGHVLTIASIAGLVGLPHLANYSASQAALVTFSHALRLELRGSGVSATVVCAGFMREAESDASSTTPVPWYLGTTTTERVARRAVDALLRDRVDTVVNPRPVRPLALLGTAGPRVAQALLARLGLPELTAAAAAKHLP
jgi:short-subunit dehydrogenase